MRENTEPEAHVPAGYVDKQLICVQWQRNRGSARGSQGREEDKRRYPWPGGGEPGEISVVGATEGDRFMKGVAVFSGCRKVNEDKEHVEPLAGVVPELLKNN